MVTEIFPLWGDDTSFTIVLNSLADAATAESNAIDNFTAATVQSSHWIEGILKGLSASNTGFCNILLKPSIDNVNFGQSIMIGAVDMNGTSSIPFSFVLLESPPYFRIAVENDSGAALDATGNELNYMSKRHTTT